MLCVNGKNEHACIVEEAVGMHVHIYIYIYILRLMLCAYTCILICIFLSSQPTPCTYVELGHLAWASLSGVPSEIL